MRERLIDGQVGEDRDRQAGVTLIEMLVTMAIFSIIMSFVYGVLLTVQKQDRDIASRTESVTQARNALETLDRQIRSGNVLYSPANEAASLPDGTTGCSAIGTNGGNCMRVYTQANGEERCVQWQVTASGQLRMRSWSPAWQTDGVVSGWRSVARGLATSATTSSFTLAGSTSPYKSRLVDITLDVKDPGSTGGTQRVRSSLTGRNTVYGFDPGVCSPVPSA